MARERAGLSIQDISARTKIRAAALEALERGNYDQLPGDFYTRAFLKAYAREVRLPEEDLLQEYDDTVAWVEPEPAPAPALTGSLDDALETWERRMILDALQRTHGVQARAAKLLGVSERSLWYRIKKLSIQVRPPEDDAPPA